MSRRRIRELAMQLLFLWDAHGQRDDALAEQFVRDAGEEDATTRAAQQMAGGTWDQREMIDPRIERLAPHWPPRRQPGVDRNILRLAVWELGNADTPPKVVIDEAIELAKHFSTEQSPAFINGVLDAILKEQRETDAIVMAFFSKTLDKLKGALKKTAQVLNTDVRTLFIPGRQIDDAFLSELEERFLQADVGVKNVERMVAAVRERWRLGKIKNAADAQGLCESSF